MNSGKTRASLMGIVGIYLLNLAYELFRDRNQESAMTMPVRILFIVLFLVFAVGLMVYRAICKKREQRHAAGRSDAAKEEP